MKRKQLQQAMSGSHHNDITMTSHHNDITLTGHTHITIKGWDCVSVGRSCLSISCASKPVLTRTRCYYTVWNRCCYGYTDCAFTMPGGSAFNSFGHNLILQHA